MKPLLKIGLGSGVVATLGGGAYGIYHISTSETYEEIFKETLLSEDSKHSETWNSRFQKLSQVKSSQIDELKNLSNLDDLKGWCKKAIKRKSGGEKDPVFKAIQNYCTQTIKDAITPLIEKSNIDNSKAWKRRQERLDTIGDNELVESLLNIKKGTDKTGSKIKEWCLSAYNETFKGQNDKAFNNAAALCDRRESISNLMGDANKELLGDSEWKAKLDEYNRQNQDPLRIKGHVNQQEALTNACKSTIHRIADKEEQEYRDFETWCTKNKAPGQA